MTQRQDRSNLRRDPLQIAGVRDTEYWLPVSGHPNYFVSDHGRVCSVDHITPHDKLRRGRVLKVGVYPDGHYYVFLGRKCRAMVHRLVLTEFRGPCPDGCEGLHNDDDPTNNIILNLRWGSRSDNLHDAVRNGKKPIGEKILHSRLTDDGVRFIRANPNSSMNSLANHLGVSCAAVKQVRDGLTWKHVT